MKLFKDIVIKQKLHKFEIPNFEEKISIIEKWLDDYENGSLKQDNETAREQGYNQDIFFNILGYTRKPAEKATFDVQYSINGKRPDGVLGYFHTDESIEDNVCAILELKGASIPLDQPQKREKNYTPIEQAFGYKRQLRNCPFVIVSNFYELRLYNDNELDYELWTLKDLLDSKDNYFNFRKFYYLLCEENLIAEKGLSKTESLLSEIRIEEQEITKKFYKDYKEKRHLLLKNLYLKNKITRENPDLLIEKGQKVIDRIIFICFAEDKGLLPPDTLQNAKKDYENSANSPSLKDTLDGTFKSVDKGNKNWNLPDGYNGGLFANDEILNDLKIDDHILSKVIDFGVYDFADQLSVTILGHIFEQSISDLEEIKEAVLEKIEKEKTGEMGEEILSDKKVSKRKKDGIFYTPEYIVDYIVKNSLGKYLREKETEIIEKYNFDRENLKETTREEKKKEVYTEYQEFLKTVKVLDPACGSGAFLVRVFDYLLEEHRRVGKILGTFFDTDETYKNILQNNIYGVDLNQESVEITKLSLWLKSAQPGKKLSNLDQNIKCGNSLIDDSKIAGGKAFKWEEEFSEIIKNGGFDIIVGNPPYGAKLQKSEQKYLTKKYIKGGSETAISFVKLSESLLKSKGFLSFIIPKSFTFSSNYKTIREFVLDDISEIVDCKKVWKEVKLEQIIFVLNKNNKTDLYKSSMLNGKNINEIGLIDKDTFETFGFFLNGISNNELKVGKKIQSINYFLNDISKNSRGGIFQKYISDIGDTNVLGGAEIQRYGITGIKGKINREVIQNDDKVFVKNNSVLVQRIVAHLENPIGHIKITACFPQKNDFVIVDTINQIFVNDNYNAKIIWILLNSKVINWYTYRFIFAKAVRTVQFDNPTTSRIPIPEINSMAQKPFIEKADLMLELNKKFYEQKLRFLKRIQDNYELEKINKKLEKFYEMEFGDFVKELRRQKADIPLSAQDELEEYFEKNKQELINLDTKIKQTDNEIDQIVYELYDLSEEEIKIIEK